MIPRNPSTRLRNWRQPSAEGTLMRAAQALGCMIGLVKVGFVKVRLLLSSGRLSSPVKPFRLRLERVFVATASRVRRRQISQPAQSLSDISKGFNEEVHLRKLTVGCSPNLGPPEPRTSEGRRRCGSLCLVQYVTLLKACIWYAE